MKKCLFIFILLSLAASLSAFAQTQWVSYATALRTKAYEGRKFKLSALVRTERKDSTAKAQLWTRVDKPTGRGFFNNMADRPIRSTEWKTYTIEGKIDSASTRIAFGILAYEAGAFFFDDIHLSIEMQDGTWKNVYENDFENGQVGLKQGIGTGTRGIDSLFKAVVVQTDKNKYLKIEGAEIIPYYLNKLNSLENDSLRATVLYKLVSLYNNDHKKQIEFATKGLELAQKQGLKDFKIRFLSVIENCYAMENSYPEALNYAYQVLKEAELLHNNSWIAGAHNSIGAYLDELNSQEKALKHYQIALKLYQELKDNNSVALLYINIGDIYTDLSKPDLAVDYLTKAVNLLNSLGRNAEKNLLGMLTYF